MDIGKSVAWILFLAVVAAAGSFKHQEPDSPPPSGKPGVQLAAPQSATVALDTTHLTATRAVGPAVK